MLATLPISNRHSSSRDASIHRVSDEKSFSTHQHIVPDVVDPTASPGLNGGKDEKDKTGVNDEKDEKDGK